MAILVTPMVPIRKNFIRLLSLSPSVQNSIRIFRFPQNKTEADLLDVGNYRRVVPSAVDSEVRTLLFRYMGDLYRDAPD